MTTLDLFKKHRNGEISRERFLYEVRRDNNLPWITNNTSYNDAVKILKNKGIIKESVSNVHVDPAVDYVNPYFLKRGIEKMLSNEKDLTNDSYVNALNKAAKQLKANPHAFDKEMFSNVEEVDKADSKLETREVKKGNHIDKDNGMKKVKGQQTVKATSAPTKENKKTKKPKGVKVMPDKGVEGSQKIIKEISQFIKKKLNENNPYHDFHEGMQVPTPHGQGTVKEIVGGTLEVQCEDGKIYDVQMNVVSELIKRAQEEVEQPKNESFEEYGADEDQNQPDYYINVSLRDASRAIEIYRDLNIIPRESVKLDGTDSYVIDDLEIAQELLSAFQEQDIEVIDTDVPATYSEYDTDYEDELDEAGVQITPKGGEPIFVSSSNLANKEKELRAAGVSSYTKKPVG